MAHEDASMDVTDIRRKKGIESCRVLEGENDLTSNQ